MCAVTWAGASDLGNVEIDSTIAIGDFNSDHSDIASLDSDNSNQTIALYNPGEVKLYWTAPGDDGNIGRAARYDVRYRPAPYGPINTYWKWFMSAPASGEPIPSPAGSTDSMTIRGLTYGGSYYFCIRAYDEVENFSLLSTSIMLTAGDTVDPSDFIPGDANGNGECRGSDVLYLTSYFKGVNQPPHPFLAGDANGDCNVNSADITYLVRYFKGFGIPPRRGDCFLLSHSDTGDKNLPR